MPNPYIFLSMMCLATATAAAIAPNIAVAQDREAPAKPPANPKDADLKSDQAKSDQASAALDTAALNLEAQIEDDLNPGDTVLYRMQTKGCVTQITARKSADDDSMKGAGPITRSWTVDWAKAEFPFLLYNIIGIAAPGIKFNIVTDGSDAQMANLEKLNAAMVVKFGECGGG